MKNNYLKNIVFGLLLIFISKGVKSDRIKDSADVAGVRSNHLVGMEL